MKKFLLSLLVLLTIAAGTHSAKAISYSDAISDSKPMALLVYASWADKLDEVTQKFQNIQTQYAQTYNFVMLDIASQDTKEFNKKFHIYPNLPYVLLFKDGGRVSRYLQQTCILDDACFSERLNMFTN